MFLGPQRDRGANLIVGKGFITPCFIKNPHLYRLPHFFKFCPTHLSLLTCFFGWMGGPAHLLCYFVFNDIMDLQVASLNNLLCFLATSRQVYRGLTHEWYVSFCYSILILQSSPYKIKCEEKLVSNVSPVFFTLVHLCFSLFKSKIYKKWNVWWKWTSPLFPMIRLIKVHVYST